MHQRTGADCRRERLLPGRLIVHQERSITLERAFIHALLPDHVDQCGAPAEIPCFSGFRRHQAIEDKAVQREIADLECT